VAAARFQVHATLKGFFKKTPGPLKPLMACLDAVFAAQKPFPVEIHGLRDDDGHSSLPSTTPEDI
jgi:2'-5' RNA ligase